MNLKFRDLWIVMIFFGAWPKTILKLILENLILLRDGCININEVIWLFEKVSVSIND